MRETLRASKLLALLFRLVMILSLAGYSVSTVNAAMHGPDTVGMQHDQSAMMDHGKMMDHGGLAMTLDNHDNHNMADNDSIGTPVISSIRSFPDDSKAPGQSPLLHRPPNI